jgi:hypothetical protein
VLLTLCLSLPLWAQTAPPVDAPAPAAPAPVSETVLPLEPLNPTAAQAAPAVAAPVVEGCRPLTDRAMAADMKAMTAQSQKLELAEQLRLFDDAVSLWSLAQAQCDGRAKERAQRNLADSQKVRGTLSEQLGSGPECAASQKDAGALQDMARQALSDRKWSEASLLFRKAENMWDAASERCTGAQQEIALRRRDQSEIDGQNAEFCAPLFAQAREQTQKLRATAAGLSREEKQDASQVAETLWRDAMSQCKGTAVQDAARNNAQALARERGTPWVARVAPAAPAQVFKLATPVTPAVVTPAAAGAPARSYEGGKPVRAGVAVAPAALPAAAVVAQPAAAAPPQAIVQAGEFTAGTTRFKGQFVQDADGTTYSGTGKLVWANGDVFEGTLSKGQRHGKGTFVWANGQRYSGDWVNDKAQGQASVQFANGNQYEGAVLAGIAQGSGRMRYASGDNYSGDFHAGEPQGRGNYVWKNGQQFDGEWTAGKPNGQGKLEFVNGSHYTGAVVDGVPNGQGKILMKPGEGYEGLFVNGVPEGQGIYTWSNGDHYVGLWKAGHKHGAGVFTWGTGERWEGVYDRDEQTGPAQR